MCTRSSSGTLPRFVAPTKAAALLASAGLFVAPTAALATNNPQNGPAPAAMPNGPDLNGSGYVDFPDLIMMLTVMNNPTTANPAWVAAADLNTDGRVDFADLSVLLSSFGQLIPPPPPVVEPPPPPPPPAEEPPAPEQPPAPPSASAPVMSIGSGFFGPLTLPGPVGNPGDAGIDAKAIARWNAVPGQFITGQFNVGVVAFHMNGINRVEFIANGGPVATVNGSSINPDTGNREYWVTINADELPDGPVELRAVAYPNTGIPRVLQGEFNVAASTNGEYSLVLNVRNGDVPTVYVTNIPGAGSDTNPGTRQAPFATIGRAIAVTAAQDRGHDIVLLNPGDYEAPSNHGTIRNTKWVTVRPDDGIGRDEVTLTNPVLRSMRQAAERVRWKGMSIDNGRVHQFYNLNQVMSWVDGCRMFDSRGWASEDNIPPPVRNPWFATDTLAEDKLYAFQGAALARNCHAQRISGDVFQMSKFVVGCTVETVNSSIVPSFHSDVFQFWGPQENVIAYDVVSTDLTTPQCLFMRPSWVNGDDGSQTYWMRNTAFVDLKFDMHPIFQWSNNANAYVNAGGAPWTQLQGKFDHVLFDGVELANQRLIIRSSNSVPEFERLEAHNLIFRNMGMHPISYAEFHSNSGAAVPAGIEFVNCYSHPDAD